MQKWWEVSEAYPIGSVLLSEPSQPISLDSVSQSELTVVLPLISCLPWMALWVGQRESAFGEPGKLPQGATFSS